MSSLGFSPVSPSPLRHARCFALLFARWPQIKRDGAADYADYSGLTPSGRRGQGAASTLRPGSHFTRHLALKFSIDSDLHKTEVTQHCIKTKRKKECSRRFLFTGKAGVALTRITDIYFEVPLLAPTPCPLSVVYGQLLLPRLSPEFRRNHASQ